MNRTLESALCFVKKIYANQDKVKLSIAFSMLSIVPSYNYFSKNHINHDRGHLIFSSTTHEILPLGKARNIYLVVDKKHTVNQNRKYLVTKHRYNSIYLKSKNISSRVSLLPLQLAYPGEIYRNGIFKIFLRKNIKTLRADTGKPIPYKPIGGVWQSLRMCESGNNYSLNTGNGYYGAYQFALSTWWSIGFTGLPNQASPEIQDEAAVMLQKISGWVAWPQCSSNLGLIN